jgi:hypothetical protein
MTLNWSLITKLAKLANHNPNDNEANAAARKVCQLLEDGGFNGTQKPTPKQQEGSWTRPQPAPASPIYDDPIFKDLFNEYFRNRNPFYGSERSDYAEKERQEAERVKKEEEQAGWNQRERERVKAEEWKRKMDEKREQEEKDRADQERRMRDRKIRDNMNKATNIYGEPRKHKKDPSGWS